MAVFSSPFLAPIRWMFGWRHEGKLVDQYANGYPNCPTEYGTELSVEAAFQISTVWACIRLIAETVATLPIIVYRRGGPDERTVASDHPLYELLHDAPNADCTALEYWEGVVTSLCTWGNAYSEKVRLGNRLVALQPLRADSMEVFRTERGRRRYRYHEDKKGPRELDEDQVFHVRGFGNGGDVGLSPIGYARHSLYNARAADKASASLFDKGLRGQGVLTIPQVLNADQRKQIRENIVGPFTRGETMVLEADMKWQPVSLNPEDAQMLESRSFQIEEICRWFRVPPFMVGHTQKSTSWGTGLEQQQIGFLTFALEPYLERIEQAIRRSLIAPGERASIFAEFKVEKLLRADSAARASFYSTMVTNGIMSRNEARALENMPPKPGADDLTAQAQNVPVGSTPRIAPPAGEED